jgi:polysaccharide export outer membrane protein
MGRGWGGVVALVWGLGLAGCSHASGAVRDDEPAPPFVLGREDVVEVSVYRDPELTRTVAVRPDGRISLPMAGEVMAAGRTPEQLREEIVARLGAVVQSPTVVSVIVREVNSARFYVVGEVMRPGGYPLRGELGVLQAIAAAGGPGEYSDRSRVELLRAASGRRLELTMGDLEAGLCRVQLFPGDTVVVR